MEPQDGTDLSGMPAKGPTAKCYPSEEQYERWKENAEEAGMSVSEFIASMVEAGHKRFSVEARPDETNRKLRRERRELLDQLEECQDQLQTLQRDVHTSEADAVVQFVRENPGAEWQEIVEDISLGVSERVTEHLETLEGSEVRREDGEYYPIERSHDAD